jgi:hypothetical protein
LATKTVAKVLTRFRNPPTRVIQLLPGSFNYDADDGVSM